MAMKFHGVSLSSLGFRGVLWSPWSSMAFLGVLMECYVVPYVPRSSKSSTEWPKSSFEFQRVS